MTELWKDIEGYEGLYEVSTEARIRSKARKIPSSRNPNIMVNKKEAIRKTFPNQNGYPAVTLSKDNKLKMFTVHQLVARAFIPGFVASTHINHIDGNRADSRLSNIEESDPSHNQLHAVRTGLRPLKGTSKYRNVSYVKNPRAIKKWAGSIRHAGKSSYGWKTFNTEEEAAKHVDSILDSIGDTSRLRNFP